MKLIAFGGYLVKLENNVFDMKRERERETGRETRDQWCFVVHTCHWEGSLFFYIYSGFPTTRRGEVWEKEKRKKKQGDHDGTRTCIYMQPQWAIPSLLFD